MAASLVTLAAQAGQPYPGDTLTVITPSGGRHLYFRMPPGIYLRNTAGRLGWKIDTRGHGGFVVAPGSLRRDGRYRITRNHEIAPLPAWLTDAWTPPPPHPEPTEHPTRWPRTRRRYLQAILDGESDAVTGAQPGTRHTILLSAACTLGRLVTGGELDAHDARTGMASVGRLRSILEAHDLSDKRGTPLAEVSELQPSASAQWLIYTASRLLPPGNRDRYREEFASELLALAEARTGWRAQAGHAIRQVAAIWALRRALPSAVPRSNAFDRVRAPLGSGHDTPVQPGLPRLRDHLREPFDRWIARRQARKVLREQVRIQQAEYESYRFPGGRGRHRR
jgi:Bifunctional DNA primase/polymerase, N-terminal